MKISENLQLVCLRTLLLLIIASISTLANAKYRRYQAELDNSEWSYTGNRLQCRLSQKIPFYGDAYFVSKSGLPNLKFRIKLSRNQPAEYSSASLDAQPPIWKHGAHPRNLGTVDVVPGAEPLKLDHDKAWRLLSELEQGFDPSFRYKDWLDGRDTVVVSVSSIRFWEQYQNFIDCVGQLLPYEFNDIAHTVLNYEFNSAQFTPQSREILAKIKNYLEVDKQLEVVLIAGHTDNRGKGRYNKKLSARRADSVKQFFIKAGISPKRMRVSSFGEARPVASNSNPLGRAKNRRVVINILK